MKDESMNSLDETPLAIRPALRPRGSLAGLRDDADGASAEGAFSCGVAPVGTLLGHGPAIVEVSRYLRSLARNSDSNKCVISTSRARRDIDCKDAIQLECSRVAPQPQ